MPVHVRSVSGLQVSNGDPFTRSPHLGVLTRDLGVIEHDLDVGAPTDDERQVSDVKGTTVADDETRLALATHEVRLYLDVARFEVVVNEDLDRDRPDEGVALRERVLSHGLFEFAHQGLL